MNDQILLSAKKRRYCITLIEILLVIALLALITSSIAISGNKFLQTYQFETSAAEIKQKIELCWQINHLANCDIEFAITLEEKGALMAVIDETNWTGLVPFVSQEKLPKIDSLEWLDAKENLILEGNIKIKFMHGQMFPRINAVIVGSHALGLKKTIDFSSLTLPDYHEFLKNSPFVPEEFHASEASPSPFSPS